MSPRRAGMVPALAFGILTLAPGVAAAQAGGTPSGQDDDGRYAILDEALSQNSRHERTWWTTWTVSYAALAVGQGAFAWGIRDDGLRADAGVGAVKSALGLLALLVTPRSALGAPSALHALGASTPEARHVRRLRAEELLHTSAQEELLATSWLPHVAAAATNLAGAYFLFHEERRFVPGWLSLASGTLVAEIQILTQPTDAVTAWNRYAGRGPSAPSGRPNGLFHSVSVAPALGGLFVLGTF